MKKRGDILCLLGRLAYGETQPIQVVRQAAVRWALARCDGNVSQAAQILGTNRGMIYRYGMPQLSRDTVGH